MEYVRSIDFEANAELAWNAVTGLYQMCYAPGMPGYSLGENLECVETANTFLPTLPIETYENAQRGKYLTSLTAIANQNHEQLKWIFSEGMLDNQESIFD